jgi:peptide/nickel transport system permease protein
MNPRTQDAIRSFTRNRLAVVGLLTFTFLIILCFLGPLLWQTDQVHISLSETFLSPTTRHPLGTDDLGRDLLGRLMLGGQISLIVGVSAALISTSIGALYGAISGYFGGVIDSFMMRIVDAIISIPTIFLILFLAAIVKPSISTLILAISLTSWLVPARVVRGEAMGQRKLDYVTMVKVMGGSSLRAVTKHVLPNTISTLVVNATFQVADAILMVATLSFLGLGPRPPAASWGGVLSNGLQYEYSGYWWLIYPAGFAIIVSIVAINLIGDGLRDALSPRSSAQ